MKKVWIFTLVFGFGAEQAVDRRHNTMSEFSQSVFEAFRTKSPELLAGHVGERVHFYMNVDDDVSLKSKQPKKEFPKSRIARLLFDEAFFREAYGFASCESFATAFSDESFARNFDESGFENMTNADPYVLNGKKYSTAILGGWHAGVDYDIHIYCETPRNNCKIYRFKFSQGSRKNMANDTCR